MTPAAERKRASLYTLGCRLNQGETAILHERLIAGGYDIVPFGEPADLGIINTCTVTRHADAKSRKAVRGFIRKNPHAYVAVVGCYSQVGPEALSAIGGIDLIVGTQEKLNVLDYARHGKNARPLVVRDTILRDDFTIDAPTGLAQSHRPNLKIQDGCDFMCSFCVIPFARGRARSRDFDNLLDEARAQVARGARELVLTGVNIGTYAHHGRTLLHAIDALNEIDGVRRIRISSIEPTTVPDALLDRMADPDHALAPYLHLPVQSGSDRVLSRMRRRYTSAEIADFVREASARVPDLCIGTDLLVGMPGESEADFEATCALLTNGPFGYAHVFKYSERPGTAAARLDGPIDAAEMDRRGALIRWISARKHAEFHARFIGRRMQVLFEHRENGLWSGYTANYLRVAVASDAILDNELCDVIVRESRGDAMLGALSECQSIEVNA